MGGLSGSNLADAAMEAKLLVPEMEKKGFSKEFSSVVTATSAMITPLIPPGIGMIVYASVTNTSVGKLFISGIGVGAILCIAMMIMVRFVSKKRGYKPLRTEKVTKPELWQAFKGAALPLCLPIIIIGGIRIGIFTPTEAGAVAIVYSLILGFVYRKINLKNLVAGLKETVLTTAAIRSIHDALEGKVYVGAGTVLTREQVDLAKEAGALYIITPSTNPDVIRYAKEQGLVTMPGAMTPSEVVEAYEAGADFVKIFPVGNLGAAYIKAVKAPLSHIPILAVGGVNEKNIAEFLRMGAVGAGVGGNLVNTQWIKNGEFDKITALAEEFVKNAKGE